MIRAAFAALLTVCAPHFSRADVADSSAAGRAGSRGRPLSGTEPLGHN
jgi:hypothetical protein